MVNQLQITEGLELVDLALYLPQARTLVLADVHLGFEQALHREGTLVPRGHFQQLLARLERVLVQLDASRENPLNRVILNGDLSHQFGHLTIREWTEARELLAYLENVSQQIIVIEGNHDVNVEVLSEASRKAKIFAMYELGDLLFLHGHSEPQELSPQIQTLVIGHEHPAVGLRDSVTGRVELYKCFLVGRYGDRRLIVQPSFNPWTQGSDLLRERCLSPLLTEEALGKFEVYPVSDEGKVYRFGVFRNLTAVGSRVRG